jgi:O-antigen/teichoic acid export membrane protein
MDDVSKPVDSNHTPNTSSVGKFVSPGILLFIDQLIVAIGGWAYWLVISKFATTPEIGHATTVYSLVLMVTTITQLGFEYPLLRKSYTHRSSILGTIIVIEMAITAASILFVLYAINSLYGDSLQEFAWLAVGILLFSSLFFVSRFALLGISDAKNVLIFDVLGTVAKFAGGYTLVLAGFGTQGILVSFLLYSILISCGTLLVARKSFSFRFGDKTFAKEIFKDALVNTPSKLSRMFILSLSVVLLALFGVSSAETGIFYIAVMISIAAGGFASSIAFMVIPASSASKTDLSSGGMRLGLSFTAPVIAALVTAPKAILLMIGTEYAETAETALLVLSIGILPSAIVGIAISRLNNLGKRRELVLIGSIQLAAFFGSFFILVPEYSILGAAYAMLIAFVCSAVPSIVLLERRATRYISISIASIMAGWAVGYLITNIAHMPPSIAIAAAVIASLALTFKLGNTSTGEMRQIIRLLTRK